MWSIGEMKKNGWNWVRTMFGPAYLACLVSFALNGLKNGQLNPLLATGMTHSWMDRLQALGPVQMFFLLISFSAMAMLIGIGSLLFKFCILNPVEAGVCRYFLLSREQGQPAELKTVFYAFTCGSYWNVIKILFLRDLYTSLWTLLLVIPGIYKGLEYTMIPWLLAEQPDLDSREAFVRTREMMDGNRMHVFLLILSFIGWYLLAALAAGLLGLPLKLLSFSGIVLLSAWMDGLAGLLVRTYESATMTELYLYLKSPVIVEEAGSF